MIVQHIQLDLVEVQYVQAWLVGLLLFLVLALEEVMLDEAWILGAKVKAQQVPTVFDQFLSIVLVEVFDHAHILVAWMAEQHVLLQNRKHRFRFNICNVKSEGLCCRSCVHIPQSSQMTSVHTSILIKIFPSIVSVHVDR